MHADKMGAMTLRHLDRNGHSLGGVRLAVAMDENGLIAHGSTPGIVIWFENGANAGKSLDARQLPAGSGAEGQAEIA
ncbi:hypothetical protein RSO01_20960 [Reyranella soli]|uniref:Uncharacterized protein n=1 Tax=Reyranella soli TaxID=1230389 RepID=A0A512N7G4_9HYPH|nr:hypothetical protein RSO01_20960 [Reyranella soli]